MSTESPFPVDQAHLHFAKTINLRVWDLLGKEARSPAENEELIHAAHASLYHWLQVGTGVNHQRGEWLISHVYAVLGDAPAALRHALRCWELTETHRAALTDFDLAYGYEALARAHALAGNQPDAQHYHALAAETGAAIADEEDRSIFLGDLAGGNWKGLL